MESTRVRPIESREDRIFRHLQRAKAEGVTILTEAVTGETFATSSTMDGAIYRVSETGCSCQGFTSHGCCKHFAAILDHIGKRPATDAEIAAAAVECDRYQELFRAGRLKTTADFMLQHRANDTYRRLIATRATTPNAAAA